MDLQVNGYNGISFSDETLTFQDALRCCELVLRKGGCCAVVPTVVTASLSAYETILPILADVCDALPGRVLGIHLEGPFISEKPGAVGAHPARHVVDPDAGLLESWQSLARGHVRLVTIAPEVPGAVDFIRRAVAMNVRVSLGHSLATADAIRDAATAGASLVTHLGNGCPNMIHRSAGAGLFLFDRDTPARLAPRQRHAADA